MQKITKHRKPRKAPAPPIMSMSDLAKLGGGKLGLAQGQFRPAQPRGMQDVLAGLDALQDSVGNVDRRQGARPVGPRQFNGCQFMQRSTHAQEIVDRSLTNTGMSFHKPRTPLLATDTHWGR